ncbi:MAG: NAD(+)/NADH kinase [Halorientalis sp.]
MKVGIVAQRGNDRAAAVARELLAGLDAEDVSVVVDEATAATVAAAADREPSGVPVTAMADCDLVVSVGGDGTFLYAARGAGTTPVVGVNLGEVGFLNAVAPENALEAVRTEVEHLREYGTARTRAADRVVAAGDGWTAPPAINEVCVLGPQRGHGQGITASVRVDGSDYAAGHVDGVLVATPTGSTAYNLSEGGPLVHPDVSGLVVTEMAPRDGMPPLIVDADSELKIALSDAAEATVVGDGRVAETVRPPTTVTVRRADEPVNVAGPPLDFFAALGKLD